MVNKSKKRVAKKGKSPSKNVKTKKITKQAVEKKVVTKDIVPFKRPQRQRAKDKLEVVQLDVVKPDKKKQLARLDGERTLIEIIEDTKSGIAAKSELEQKEKNKFLKKRDAKQDSKMSEELKSQNSSAKKQSAGAPRSQISVLDNKVVPSKQQQQAVSSKPKLVLVNGRPQIQTQQVVHQSAQQNALADGREITVVNSNNNKLSSLSFMKRQPSEKWKPEETQKFFMALQIFGTDFSLIEQIFKQQRTRDQIKNKFRKEERKSKKFVDDLLQNKDGATLKGFEEAYGAIDLGQQDPDIEIKDEDSSDSSSDNSDNQDNVNGSEIDNTSDVKFESPTDKMQVARVGYPYNGNSSNSKSSVGFMGSFHQSHTLFPQQNFIMKMNNNSNVPSQTKGFSINTF